MNQLAAGHLSDSVAQTSWPAWLSLPSAACFLLSAFQLGRKPSFARRLGWGGIALTTFGIAPWIASSPFVALVVGVMIVFLSLEIFDVDAAPVRRQQTTRDRTLMQSMPSPTVPDNRMLVMSRGQARGSLSTAAIANGLLFFHGVRFGFGSVWPAIAVAMISLFQLARWGWTGLSLPRHDGFHRTRNQLAVVYVMLTSGMLLFASLPGALDGFATRPNAVTRWRFCACFLAPCVGLLLLKSRPALFRRDTTWWAPLIDHPARVLVSSFLLLCLIGTGVLLMPGIVEGGRLSLLDAAFTSVSAVCVTGLVVADTATYFSFAGQLAILALIQLGGLGIMTISTAALHFLGRRLTLKQERLLTSMSDESKGDLARSLAIVVLYTLSVELLGALMLCPQFRGYGDNWSVAVWRAIFTSVSAFCNAGFALQTESLVPYASSSLVLHTIGIVIVAGGIAPATALALPQWLRRRPVPSAAYLVLNCSAVLLTLGAIAYLALEWQATLAHLGIWDKFHNAWFQSVTLRTAGFNTVDLAGVTTPTFLVMLALMFIGGSPGGTAGGVKTATIGVLSLAMWANVTGRHTVSLRGRHLAPAIVYRAVAVIGAGLFIWFVLVLALAVTQPLGARELIFEATSAVATVGLSIGATGELDGVGKVIIIVGMFLGRIGPLTIFMLLGHDTPVERQHLPPTTIPLT